jgi:glycosyltransferase involved in cell wall biosynthesis
VTVLARVDRDQLYEQLQRADVFLFPTLSEGFSCALLEAMAAELPIVTTSVGAAADLLDNGRNGVLVPCANASALVAAVFKMESDVQTRRALGVAARQTAARFTARAACVEFATRIHDIVERRGTVRTDRAVVHPDAA